MNKVLAIIIFLVAVSFVVGSVFLFRGANNTAQNAESAGHALVPVTIQKGTAQLPASAPKTYYQTIDIDSQSFSFKPDLFRVKMGTKVTITVNSHGDHTFVIDQFNVNVKTADGKKTQFSFMPNKKGAFPYYCSHPGHRDAGQQGMLIVE